MTTNLNPVFETAAGWCYQLRDGSVYGPFNNESEARQKYNNHMAGGVPEQKVEAEQKVTSQKASRSAK